MLAANDSGSGQIENLRRLIATLRAQCDEKDERIRRLLLDGAASHSREIQQKQEGNRVVQKDDDAAVVRLTAERDDLQKRHNLAVANLSAARRDIAALSLLLRDGVGMSSHQSTVPCHNGGEGVPPLSRVSPVINMKETRGQEGALRENLKGCEERIARLQRQLEQAEQYMAGMDGDAEFRSRCAVERASRGIIAANSAELENLLEWRATSLRGFVERQSDQEQQKLRDWEFIAQKHERLAEQLRAKSILLEQENSALRRDIIELQRNEQLAQDAKEIAKAQTAAHANATSALNAAQSDALRLRSMALENRLGGVEALLRQKDQELQALQLRVEERERSIALCNKTNQTLQFEIQLAAAQLKETEREARQREEHLQGRIADLEDLRRDEASHADAHFRTQEAALLAALSQRDAELSRLRKDLAEVPVKMAEADERAQKREDEIAALRSRVIDLEAQLVTADQSHLIRDAEEREVELENRLRQMQARMTAAQQDSILLHQMRLENATLQRQLTALSTMRTPNGKYSNDRVSPPSSVYSKPRQTGDINVLPSMHSSPRVEVVPRFIRVRSPQNLPVVLR